MKLKILIAVGAVFIANVQADTFDNANIIFNWGEDNYPQYFQPARVETSELLGYIVRYYSETDTYLGIKEGRVYVYGKLFGGLLDVGAEAELLSMSNAGAAPDQLAETQWEGTVKLSGEGQSCTWNYASNFYGDQTGALATTLISNKSQFRCGQGSANFSYEIDGELLSIDVTSVNGVAIFGSETHYELSILSDNHIYGSVDFSIMGRTVTREMEFFKQ